MEQMRERVFDLMGKRFLPKWIKVVGLHNLVFPIDDIYRLRHS
ncbi:hypothetical protein SOVF_142560 [Spinacia oleracea]|nr:hypothetical protein SOVF_142560 [Spinacia oleracea]